MKSILQAGKTLASDNFNSYNHVHLEKWSEKEKDGPLSSQSQNPLNTTSFQGFLPSRSCTGTSR